MKRPRIAIGLVAVLAALTTAGCGDDGQQVDTAGATLFAERCAGCHTLEAAGTEGSSQKERVAGPNLNNRRETKAQVLYAIRNGGFSGAIMPQTSSSGRKPGGRRLVRSTPAAGEGPAGSSGSTGSSGSD
jgi:mono/diheme cytochrome c family protein